jgi:putative tricarboxylic transport membrane protein
MTVFFTRGLSLAFLVVSLFLIVVSLLPALTRKREQVFVDDD